jgi:hypothetical protein
VLGGTVGQPGCAVHGQEKRAAARRGPIRRACQFGRISDYRLPCRVRGAAGIAAVRPAVVHRAGSQPPLRGWRVWMRQPARRRTAPGPARPG